MHDELEPPVVVEEQAEPVSSKVRSERGQSLWRRVGPQGRDHCLQFSRQAGRVQPPVLRDAPGIEVHLHPSCNVARVRYDAAGRVRVVTRERGHRPHLPFHFRVRRGCVRNLFDVRVARFAARHADRLQDPFGDELLPRHAALRFDEEAGDKVENVVVRVRRPETRFQRDVLELTRDLVAVIGRRWPPQEVAATKPQSAAMDQEVTYGQLFRHIRV